ncbi:MAG: hypothetical protein D3921_07820 [Candidatus Electrothrix sp. AW1]|nr:hypothetical protein [Candidatus Electrothrix sp. AX1]MCI5182409.1 hypothetical protein [Candidatus Electrothrix gigas]
MNKNKVFLLSAVAILSIFPTDLFADLLVNTLSGKCLDVSGAPGIENGTKVQLWDCEASGRHSNGSQSDQVWYFSNGFIKNSVSGKCLDVSGAPGIENGAKIQLWDCETSGRNSNGSQTDQKWYFSNGFIKNSVSGKCLDVPGAPGIEKGVQLQLWDCETSGRHSNGSQTDQKWTVKQ